MDPVTEQQVRDYINAQLQEQLNDRAALALAQVAPQVPAPVEFAMSPASVRRDQCIDYSTTQGIKIHKQATEALPIKHDLDQEKLNLFLECLASRSFMQGWDQKLLIINQHGQDLNLIEHYGTIKLESVKQHVYAYAFQESRDAQDATNLFYCLDQSLTNDALNTLHAEKGAYTVRRGDVPIGQINMGRNPNDTFQDGVLFLWMIINRTTARTNATISVIIDKLTNLPMMIGDMNNDLNEFNTKVRGLINSYYVNKHEKYDNEVLLQALFKAYKTTSDAKFTEWIERKESDHEDGTKAMTAEELLEAALKQYQTRLQKRVWGQDTNEKKDIINLTAKLVSSQTKLNQLERNMTRTNGRYGPAKGKRPMYKNKTWYNSNYKNKESKFRKMKYERAPAWMKKKPDNVSMPIEFKGRQYYWCEYHKLMQQHKTSECNLGKNNASNTTTTTSTKQNKTNYVPKIKQEEIKQEENGTTMMAIDEVNDDDDF